MVIIYAYIICGALMCVYMIYDTIRNMDNQFDKIDEEAGWSE